MALGGIILSIEVPDRRGEMANVTPAYDDLGDYERDSNYFGALIGRYANRIANARFSLDGITHHVTRNDGPNHLHGGERGFHRREWSVARVGTDTFELTRTSPAGEEGFPGRLEVRVRYSLSDENEVAVEYRATTDAPTPVSLTQHLYLNLAGAGARTILDHELTINAARFTPVGAGLVPTGQLRDVGNTPFDFTSPRLIGERIDLDDGQLRVADGYDHNFVLDTAAAAVPRLAARLRHAASGRVMELFATDPGLQLYSGNVLAAPPRSTASIARRSALALEPQHFPDSPNQPSFPSTILRPGEEYRSRSVYRFLAET